MVRLVTYGRPLSRVGEPIKPYVDIRRGRRMPRCLAKLFMSAGIIKVDGEPWFYADRIENA